MAKLKDKQKRQSIRRELYTALSEQGLAPAIAIKKIRLVLGKNQTEFAEFVGISLSALRRIEQSNGDFKIQTLMTILDRFDLTIRVHSK